MFNKLLFDELIKSSKSQKISLSKPFIKQVDNKPNFEDIKAIMDLNKKNKSQMLLLMLSKFELNNKAFYKKIKAYAFKIGLPTQVVVNDNKSIFKRGFVDNILL